MTKMYVGNLPFSMDESAVRALFESMVPYSRLR